MNETDLLSLYNSFHNDDRLLRAWAEENGIEDVEELVSEARRLQEQRQLSFLTEENLN